MLETKQGGPGGRGLAQAARVVQVWSSSMGFMQGPARACARGPLVAHLILGIESLVLKVSIWCSVVGRLGHEGYCAGGRRAGSLM